LATNYIDGKGQPHIRIYNGTVEVNNFTLPYCNIKGQSISYVGLYTEHTLLSGEIVQGNHRGYRYMWTLDYSNYVQKVPLFLVQEIFKAARLGYKIILTPFSDNQKNYYEVLLEGSLDLQPLHQTTYTSGMGLAVLKFKTKYTMDDLNFVDPEDIYCAREDVAII
jgi:hypothetical protein